MRFLLAIPLSFSMSAATLTVNDVASATTVDGIVLEAVNGVAGASSAFNPADYGYTVVTWVDPSQEPVVPNGTAMATLADFSGSGNNFTQGTGANQPLYATGIWPVPAFSFDGSDDYATSGDGDALEGISAFTSIVVVRANAVAGTYGIACKHHSSTDGTLAVGINSSAFRSMVINDTPTRVNSDTGAISTGTDYIVISTYDGAEVKSWVNGNLTTSTAAQTGNTRTRVNAWTVGNFSSLAAVNSFNGYLGDYTFILGVLDSTQRADAFSKLGTKYAITITP